MVKTYGFVSVVRGLSHEVRNGNTIIKKITFDNMEGEFVTTQDYKKLQREKEDLEEALKKLKKKPRRRSSKQTKEIDKSEEEQNGSDVS